MKPTDKQLNFIAEICSTLHLTNPKCKTKEQAKKWINKYVEDYDTMVSVNNSWFMAGENE